MMGKLDNYLNDFTAHRNRDLIGNAITLLLFGFAVGFVLAWY